MITSFQVGSDPVVVLPPPSRPYKFVAISNVGDVTAYLKVVPDEAAVTTSNGIPLLPDSAFVVDQDVQRHLFDGGASAVTDGAATTISVQAF